MKNYFYFNFNLFNVLLYISNILFNYRFMYMILLMLFQNQIILKLIINLSDYLLMMKKVLSLMSVLLKVIYLQLLVIR